MRAPESILRAWRQFDGIPLETFTKGWWHARCGGSPRQRTVAEMEEHRRLLGAGGNCFDLSVWLVARLAGEGITVRLVGHDLCTSEAHVAVLATDEAGHEYLCDLGDQWLQPILVSPEAPGFSADWQDGFYPGRSVCVKRDGSSLTVRYRRANEKEGSQTYDLTLLTAAEVETACHDSQNRLRRPFCEILLPYGPTGRTEKWEYDEQASFWNLADGALTEEPCHTPKAWAERIATRTHMAPRLIADAFAVYERVRLRIRFAQPEDEQTSGGSSQG